MYYWGSTSKRRIRGTSEHIRVLLDTFISLTPIDASIPWRGGKRSAEQQYEIFGRKASKCDGYIKLSYHQSGNAIDVAPYINGKMSTNKEHVLIIAKHMLEAFDMLKEEGIIPENIYLHSGVFWGKTDDLDGDGYLEEDELATWDLYHFELRFRPQLGTYPIKLKE